MASSSFEDASNFRSGASESEPSSGSEVDGEWGALLEDGGAGNMVTGEDGAVGEVTTASFWGVNLTKKSGGEIWIPPDFENFPGTTLHVTQAALCSTTTSSSSSSSSRSNKKGGGGGAVVNLVAIVESNEEGAGPEQNHKFSICTLRTETCEQVQLDLRFTDGVKFALEGSDVGVDLIGYIMQPVPYVQT